MIAKYPEAYRLNAFIAQTYAEEKNYDKAIEHLKIVVDKEPDDIDMKTFLAELYTAKGHQGRGTEGPRFRRHDTGEGPHDLHQHGDWFDQRRQGRRGDCLLDKVAKQFPTQSNVLYYRARANIVAKKMPEAKADLEKFVSIAPPDARELPDAKKLLEQLKDVK